MSGKVGRDCINSASWPLELAEPVPDCGEPGGPEQTEPEMLA